MLMMSPSSRERYPPSHQARLAPLAIPQDIPCLAHEHASSWGRACTHVDAHVRRMFKDSSGLGTCALS